MKIFTRAEIARFVRLLRKILGVHSRKTINILIVFEQLKKIFPKLKIRIVPDTDLDAEARANPGSWLIKIRQGIFEGLLRGDAGARWTFAHELGHVLLRHPGRPYRKRSVANNSLVEKQAHFFAAEFLSPIDIARKCASHEEIRSTFKISYDAAVRRYEEIDQYDRSQQFGRKGKPSGNPNEEINLEDNAAIICAAIVSTVAESSLVSTFLVEPLNNNLLCASMATAKATQLIVDAYGSVRGFAAVNETVSAACLAAAILAVKPIRSIGNLGQYPKETLQQNQFCALRAAASQLGFNIKDLERHFGTSNLTAHAISFRSDYLTAFIDLTEKAIETSSTVLHFNDFPSYHDYNGRNDVCWSEISQIEVIERILVVLRSKQSTVRKTD